MEYRGSCYLIYSSRITWESAQSTCSDVKGASLVSLNNNMETRYIKAVMKSYGYLKFHTQPRTWPLFKTAAFMCEYKLGELNNYLKAIFTLLYFLYALNYWFSSFRSRGTQCQIYHFPGVIIRFDEIIKC